MTIIPGQLFTGPVVSLPEEWKAIGYISGSSFSDFLKEITCTFHFCDVDCEALKTLIFDVSRDQDYIIIQPSWIDGDTRLNAIVYPDDNYRVDLVDHGVLIAWLEANHCRDLIASHSLMTVSDGIATYQAICRNHHPCRAIIDPTTGELKTWTHHMRVYHHIKEYL